MSIRLQSCDAVIVGRFNPYIVTPDWLRQQEICHDQQSKVELELDVSERRTSFSFATDGFRWYVSDTRLRIVSIGDKPGDGDPSRIAAEVVGRLPHTPVSAVGHNFLYRTTSVASMRLPQIGDMGWSAVSRASGGEVKHATWSAVIQFEDLRFNINVAQTGESQAEIVTNIHRDVASAAEVDSVASNFQDDRARSLNLVNALAGTSE